MKKIWIVFLALTCVFTLCSCGSNSANGDSAATIASMQQEITELQNRIAELEEENENLRARGSAGNSVSDNTSTESNVEASPVNIELNSTFSVGDVMDITLTGADWCDSILPSNTSKSYSYMPDKDGETFFVVHGVITSHASDSFDIQWRSDSAILVNEKYSFSATMEFEDLDGGGFGESIKPLQTRNIVIYSSVSDEVYNISESVQVNFELPDTEEQLNYFYDEDHSNASYTITFSDLKS